MDVGEIIRTARIKNGLRKKSLKKWQTRLNVLLMLHNLLYYQLHYAPNSAELEHICFWIKNKRHHANNVARCLFGALEGTRTPDLLIRSQNF